jgi:hypothetical protein
MREKDRRATRKDKEEAPITGRTGKERRTRQKRERRTGRRREKIKIASKQSPCSQAGA